MSSNRCRVKKILLEALVGFSLWTGILTPYVLLVTQMSLGQYLSWLLMQAVIVPPVAVVVLRITNFATGKLALNHAQKSSLEAATV